MKNKLITLFVILFLILGSFFVYFNYINIEKKIEFYGSISKNIFLESEKLNWTLLFFKSNTDISNYSLLSTCKVDFKYLSKKKNKYIYKLDFLGNNCVNSSFYLKKNWEKIKESNFRLNIFKKSDIFLGYVNYSDNKLTRIEKELSSETKRFSKYNKFKNKTLFNIKANRTYKELIYKKNILNNIIEKRKKKYKIPVPWYKISTWLNVIPNAARPYRAQYTDWIHRWWDIMAPKGTPVSAIDDWVIIRVVGYFDFEDISNIQKQWEISNSQKLRNLDILRWNQVWLKTTKWDVIFYSHLTEIYDNIYEWAFVNSWEYLWTIGSTWVPDREYTNFHLHFPIMKNPHNPKKVWKYSYEDIMGWDWYLKWQTPDEVIKNQKEIFVKEAF